MRRLAIALVLAALAAVPSAAQAQAQRVNDFTCKPSAQHPYPVVLVHGTLLNAFISWPTVAPQLLRDGFCVFGLDYGNNATAAMDASTTQIAQFVDRVLRETGAAKVSIVGHSQGGTQGRALVKLRGYGDRIDEVVGISPSSHGTTQPLAVLLGPACIACADQAVGSPYMQKLNTSPEAPGPVSYTVIASRYDEVVTPYQTQALVGERVTNIVIQDRCVSNQSDHVLVLYDPVVLQWVRNALLRDGPADPAFVPDCTGRTLGAAPGSPGTPAPPGSTPTGPRLSPVKPRARLTLLARPAARVRNGRLRFGVRCEGASGTGCGRTISARARGREVARGIVMLRAGRRATASIKLTRSGRRLIVRPRAPIRVTLRATGSPSVRFTLR